MNTMSPVSPLASTESGRTSEYKHGILRIRGRTLTIGNSMYQISNISSVSITDVSSTKPTPMYLWMIMAFGFLFLWMDSGMFKLMGVVGLGFACFLFYKHWESRNVARFILSAVMNAGTRLAILSDDINFLKQIVLVLDEVIEQRKDSNVSFHLDQRQIFDNITNSNVVVGAVSGDVVNHV
jgi:hypothetical protein